MKIGMSSWGHTDPKSDAPRNAMILVNWGLWNAVQKVAKRVGATAVDMSPPLVGGGIDQAACANLDRIKPVDVMLFQGGVSGHVVAHMQKINPDCIMIEQRESTHCKSWLRLMKAAQKKHGIEWATNYDNPNSIAHDLREYEAAHKILVPSGFVASTFDENGLGDKVIYYGPSMIDFWEADPRRPPFPFAVLHAAQLGIRKGTLDVFDAWRQYRKLDPRRSAVLYVAGLPEHGAPPALKQRIEHEFHTTPDVVKLNWLGRDDLRKAYARSHVLLAPSVEDGATMVGFEAGYAGCAIVSTYNAGIDLPRIDVETPRQIAQALKNLADDKKICAGWGAMARDAAQRHCNLDAYADRAANAIEEAMG